MEDSPIQQVNSSQPTFASARHVERLIEEFRRFGDLDALCATLLSAEAGLRLEEVIRLRWSDLDFPTRDIAARSPNSSAVRHVRMSPRLAEHLRHHKRASGESDFVFYPFLTRVVASERITNSFDRACRRLLFAFTFYAIRYSVRSQQ